MGEFGISSKLICSERLIKTILVLSITTSLLFSCNSYSNYEGITFIASPGKPPAQSIVWSPTDFNEVLVTSTDLNHHDNQILILNTRKLEKTILQKTDGGTLFGLDWSPDGKRILFMSTSGFIGEKGKTFTMSASGDDKEVLIEEAIDATWSPDGKTVAFFSFGREIGTNLREINLHLMNLINSEDVVVLTLESDNSLGLSWSPDGEKLVFALGSLKSSNLFVLDIATREIIQITKNGSGDSPVWSPHGDAIAYHKYSKDGLVSSLSLIRPDGSCEVEIPDLDRVTSPTWLPDGKTLAFVGLDGIYTIDLKKVFVGDIYQRECPQIR